MTASGEFKADVVLLDIGLPKLNGYEACRRIRAQSWGKNIIIIAVTGWGQADDKRKSEEAGFDRHLVKPVDPKSLMKLLTDLQTVKLQVDKIEQDSTVASDLDVGRNCVNLAGGP